MRERGTDYFENSRRDAYAQHDYATLDPMGWKGYGPNEWGFSACDGPADTALDVDGVYRWFHTYWARGVSFTRTADDGTMSPAALGRDDPLRAGDRGPPRSTPCRPRTAT